VGNGNGKDEIVDKRPDEFEIEKTASKDGAAYNTFIEKAGFALSGVSEALQAVVAVA
jgi:hypothetical protein